jgi:hypothetical protein
VSALKPRAGETLEEEEGSPMTTGEIASIAFGSFGVGGSVVALYIRGTIAETIITRLNGRYQGTKVCKTLHENLTAQLGRMEHGAEELGKKVDTGFDSLRNQLMQAQTARKEIEHDQVFRESKRTPSV